MPAEINVSMDLSQTLVALTGVSGRVKNLRPVFHGPIDQSVSELFSAQFHTEGAFGGRRWAALSQQTIKQRMQRGRGRGGILRDTSRLWASLVKRGSPEGIRAITDSRYRRGTAVPYARFHQEGTKRMPQRQVIPDPMPKVVEDAWVRIIANYVQTGDLSPFAGWS
jgi:phage gpG-like protein